jgi:hypothetical protein
MKAQNMDQSSRNKINWKIVVPALIIITILYFIMSHLLAIRYFENPEVVYCRFEKDLINDTLPRHECGYLKIVTKDLESINMEEVLSLNISVECSEIFGELSECEGDTYHFTEFPLHVFCDVPLCDVDGKICGAYYVSYYGNSTWRPVYEEGMFTEPNQSSSATIIDKLKKCD